MNNEILTKMVEPLKSNRWILKTNPIEINEFLFRRYRLFNDGEKIILETEFFETVFDVYNPMDLLEITDLTLLYLDPIGEVISGFKMIVKGINFEKDHSYSSDDLLITKLRFVIEYVELIKEYKNTEK